MQQGARLLRRLDGFLPLAQSRESFRKVSLSPFSFVPILFSLSRSLPPESFGSFTIVLAISARKTCRKVRRVGGRGWRAGNGARGDSPEWLKFENPPPHPARGRQKEEEEPLPPLLRCSRIKDRRRRRWEGGAPPPTSVGSLPNCAPKRRVVPHKVRCLRGLPPPTLLHLPSLIPISLKSRKETAPPPPPHLASGRFL